jgi:CHAD domain-containing protein
MKHPTDKDAETFGDWAYIAIAKHFNKILKHEAGVLEDKDPEELHQMRVGMRRLRSAIAGFAPALNLPKDASEKKVGQVARILGQLRDLDVLEATLKERYQPNLPKKEQKKLQKALADLEKQRKTAFKEVKNSLENQTYLQLKEAFSNWLEKPAYQEIAAISIDDILPDLLLPQAGKLLLHPGWLLGTHFEKGEPQFSHKLNKKQIEKLLTNEGIVLHELRKEAKRSRYNMELFTQFYGDSYQDYLQDIKQLQSVLGEIQDCFVLGEFLTGVFAEDFSEEMQNLAKQITEIRYQKWQEWGELQHKFLNAKTRKDFHTTILQPKVKEAVSHDRQT